MFDTYGPFNLASNDPDGINALYEQIRSDDAENLQHGIGIYIIAADTVGGEPIPWYVGMTTREFGKRLVEHFEGGKFVDLAEVGPLRVHLIALARGGRIIPVAEATEKQKLAIEQLEQQLIDDCVKLNQELLNKKRWSVNQIHVPGYIDDGGSQRDFEAARALAKLLRK